MPVVQGGECQLSGDGTDQGHAHVPLGIPFVPLGAEKFHGRLPERDGDPPFEEFVERAECQSGRADQKEEPAARPQRRCFQKPFPHHHGGDEPLNQVPESIVVVPRQTESLLHPPSGRDLRVRVVTADDQDGGMQGEEPVEQRGERVAAIRRDQNGKNDYNRENFQKPGQPVFRREAGDNYDSSFSS